jgi:Methylamine utilisation protein MauE
VSTVSHGLDPLIIAIAAGALLLTFARGAWHKLADHPMFRAILENYEIVPARFVPAVAIGLTAVEAAIALCLLFPGTLSLAALSALVLLALYAIAMAINLRRGRVNIDCGCGGPGHGLSWILVGRNFGLMAVALIAAWPALDRVMDLADMLVLVAAVGTVALVLVIVEQAGSNGAYVVLERNNRQRG